MRTRTVGLLAIFALLIASCGGGSVEGEGVSSGIGVHGAWTIDVINADGSLDRHLEFDNDLLGAGEARLATLLAKTATPGSWTVELGSDLGIEICDDGGTPNQWCLISDGASTAGYEFPGLVTNLDAHTVQLSGSMTASLAGQIIDVSTHLPQCASSVAPDDCSVPFSRSIGDLFTHTVMRDPLTGDPAPVGVAAGQTVQVEVTLSFGTLP